MRTSLENELKFGKAFLMCAVVMTLDAGAISPGGILDYRRYEKDSLMYDVSNVAMGVNYLILHSPIDAIKNFNPPNKEYFCD